MSDCPSCAAERARGDRLAAALKAVLAHTVSGAHPGKADWQFCGDPSVKEARAALQAEAPLEEAEP